MTFHVEHRRLTRRRVACCCLRFGKRRARRVLVGFTMRSRTSCELCLGERAICSWCGRCVTAACRRSAGHERDGPRASNGLSRELPGRVMFHVEHPAGVYS